MSSPVLSRLADLLEDYGIPVGEHYRKYGPQHFKMYELLDKQGLMECKSRLVSAFGTDGLPALIEVPFRERDVTITILPPNSGKHRVMVTCDCGKLVPFGRLYQHKCKTGK